MAAPYNSIWTQLKHGSHLALELVVGGQRYSGEEIAAKGIALMAVDDTRVLESARDYCAKLARNDGTAMHVRIDGICPSCATCSFLVIL